MEISRLPSSKRFASLYTDFLLYPNFRNAKSNHFCVYLIRKASVKKTVHIQCRSQKTDHNHPWRALAPVLSRVLGRHASATHGRTALGQGSRVPSWPLGGHRSPPVAPDPGTTAAGRARVHESPREAPVFYRTSEGLTLTSRRPETSRGGREQLRLRATDGGGTESSRFLFLVTLRDLLAWTA